MVTFNVLPFDSLDSDVRIVHLVVALIHITILPRPYFPLKDIIINHLRHPAPLQ